MLGLFLRGGTFVCAWFASCIRLNRYTDPTAGAGMCALHKRESRSTGTKTMIGTQQLDDNFRGAVLALALIAVTATGAILANELSLGFAVGAAAAIVIFTVSFVSQEIALYILIASMLLGPQVVLDNSTLAATRGRGFTLRFDDLLIVLIGLSWFLKTAVNKELGLFLRTPLNRPIAFYFLVCLVSTLIGSASGNVRGMGGFFFVLKYFEFNMIYFMAVNHLKKKEQIERFLSVMLIVCFLVCLYGISQIPSGIRVSAPFEGEMGEPNTLGGYLILMMSVVIGLLVTKGAFRFKKSLLVLLGLMLVTLGATQSRGSWVALPALILTLIYFTKNRMTILLPLIALLLASPILLPKSVVDRASYTFNQPLDPGQIQIGTIRVDTSTSARLESWKLILTQDFQKHPLLGYGVTGYTFLDAQYARVLAETGLMGLCAFLLLLGAIWKIALRTYRGVNEPLFRGLALGYLGGLAGLCFHGIGANTFIIVRIMEPFWFITAMIVMIPVIEKQEMEKSGAEIRLNDDGRGKGLAALGAG
jgi:O-antigen ligase